MALGERRTRRRAAVATRRAQNWIWAEEFPSISVGDGERAVRRPLPVGWKRKRGVAAKPDGEGRRPTAVAGGGEARRGRREMRVTG